SLTNADRAHREAHGVLPRRRPASARIRGRVWSRSCAALHMEDVHGLSERIEPYVVVVGPGPYRARDEVFHFVPITGSHAPDAGVQVYGRLAHGVRVDIRHDDDRVGDAVGGEEAVEILRVHQDAVVVAPVHREVAQLTQRWVTRANGIQP